MSTLAVLAIFVCFALTCLVLMEVRERQRAKQAATAAGDAGNTENPQQEKMVRVPVDDECCGRHSVCERESLLTSKPDIIYYEDEELDRLKGVEPDDYTEKDLRDMREVFETLQDKDVAGWLRSLQLREITPPQDILEEALMIVSERRFAHSKA